MHDHDLASYHEHGYLLLDVLPSAEVLRIRDQINAVLDQHGQRTAAHNGIPRKTSMSAMRSGNSARNPGTTTSTC